MTMLPVVENRVRFWFNGLPSDFSDAPSFRTMISIAEREVEQLRALVPQYKRAGFNEIVSDCERDIALADELIAVMKARLEDLMTTKRAGSEEPAPLQGAP